MLTTDTFTRLRPARTRDAHQHEVIGPLPAEGPAYAGHAMPDVPPVPDVDRGQVPVEWRILLVPGADVQRGDRLRDTAGRLYVVVESQAREGPSAATEHVRVVATRVVDGATTP